MMNHSEVCVGPYNVTEDVCYKMLLIHENKCKPRYEGDANAMQQSIIRFRNKNLHTYFIA